MLLDALNAIIQQHMIYSGRLLTTVVVYESHDSVTANSMSICPPQERKSTRRRAHAYQNTTHGAASWSHMPPLVYNRVRYSFCCCGYPMQLRVMRWLPTFHFPHIRHNNQTRYDKEASTGWFKLNDGNVFPGRSPRLFFESDCENLHTSYSPYEDLT